MCLILSDVSNRTSLPCLFLTVLWPDALLHPLMANQRVPTLRHIVAFLFLLRHLAYHIDSLGSYSALFTVENIHFVNWTKFFKIQSCTQPVFPGETMSKCVALVSAPVFQCTQGKLHSVWSTFVGQTRVKYRYTASAEVILLKCIFFSLSCRKSYVHCLVIRVTRPGWEMVPHIIPVKPQIVIFTFLSLCRFKTNVPSHLN